jgi:hypothetical protein
MALQIIVETLDDVDEKYHDLYTEKDGKFELTGVEGMKTKADVDRLQTALTKERADHKNLKERVKLLGDRKIEDVIVELDRIPELEAAAKGDKNVDELVEAKLRAKIVPVERERDKYAKELEEAKATIGSYESASRVRKIHDSIRSAVGKQQGFQKSAIEDAVTLGERLFEVLDDGSVVTKDNVGVTPGISAEDWLSDRKNDKPHWWGTSQGGGAAGSRGAGVTGDNPWTNGGWNLTKQGQIIREDPKRAEQLARAAGTTIGGPKPEAKK